MITRTTAYMMSTRLGGVTELGRWTYHQEVVGSTRGQVVIKWLLPEWVTVYGQVNYLCM